MWQSVVSRKRWRQRCSTYWFDPTGAAGGSYYSVATFPQWMDALSAADPFTTVRDALKQIARQGPNDGDSIIRVEAITTPGKSTRVEVPLGDARQIGVAIKCGRSYANIEEKLNGNWLWNTEIARAQVFPATDDVIPAVARASQRDAGVASNIGGRIVGIAEVSTPGTTTYTETVLA